MMWWKLPMKDERFLRHNAASIGFQSVEKTKAEGCVGGVRRPTPHVER